MRTLMQHALLSVIFTGLIDGKPALHAATSEEGGSESNDEQTQLPKLSSLRSRCNARTVNTFQCLCSEH